MIALRIPPKFKPDLETKAIKRVVQAVLDQESASAAASLTIVITGDDKIRALNRQFRCVDAPTDVLAFGQDEPPGSFVDGSDEPPYLGDVVISWPRAQEQALEHGHSAIAELNLLLVHGVLHLLGYDHATPEQEAQMWTRQSQILKSLPGG